MSATPPGWKLVPMEPTPEMDRAGEIDAAWSDTDHMSVYRAMIAAAPKPPQPEEVSATGSQSLDHLGAASNSLSSTPATQAVAYVPRALADGANCVVGEFRWQEIDEKPFECSNPQKWECCALYIAPQPAESQCAAGRTASAEDSRSNLPKNESAVAATLAAREGVSAGQTTPGDAP